jgi:hypothetical protein
VNHQNENPNPPPIVGFESTPLPVDNSENITKYGLIGVGALIVAWFLFMPNIKIPDGPGKIENAKYVAPQRSGTSFLSVKEAQESMQLLVEKQQEETRRMMESIINR